MGSMRSIEIDIEIHKRIEIARISFEETANQVLRRLLGIDDDEKDTLPSSSPPGRPWSGKEVVLPHGTQLRMEYNGKVYSGRIDDGRWQIDGKFFTSPSGAAKGVAVTKSGTPPNLDGWRMWTVKRPGDESWTEIKSLVPRTSSEETQKLLSDLGL